MNIFKRPYPKGSSKGRKYSFALAFGVFVFLFLLLFQPFGLNAWETDYKILKLAGYGFVTAFVILFNAFVLEGLFKKWHAEKHWTVGKEIISAVWNILFIGSLNLLYTRFLGVARIDLMSFLAFQWITLSIGIIPVTIVTLLNYSRLVRLNTRGAIELNSILEGEALLKDTSDAKEVTLIAENGKDSLSIMAEDIMAIEAADNYIEVYFIKNGEIRKELLRSTLKKVEGIIHNFPQFMRCHRSFIVNLDCINNVTGNSQGLKLHVKNSDLVIPVSRSLNNIVKQRMQERHPVRPS